MLKSTVSFICFVYLTCRFLWKVCKILCDLSAFSYISISYYWAYFEVKLWPYFWWIIPFPIKISFPNSFLCSTFVLFVNPPSCGYYFPCMFSLILPHPCSLFSFFHLPVIFVKEAGYIQNIYLSIYLFIYLFSYFWLPHCSTLDIWRMPREKHQGLQATNTPS